MIDALSDVSSSVALSFGWNVLKDLPLPSSQRGGPLCTGTKTVAVAMESRDALSSMVSQFTMPSSRMREATTVDHSMIESSMVGSATMSVPLLRLKVSPDGNITNTPALFPLFWLLKGDECVARPLTSSDITGGGDALPGRRRQPPDMSWSDRWLACNASLVTSDDDIIGMHGETRNAMDGSAAWWKLRCWIVDEDGAAIVSSHAVFSSQQKDTSDGAVLRDDGTQRAFCPYEDRSDDAMDTPDPGVVLTTSGPQMIALLDRVQGGIIGATLNKFGVIGLYSVFVYGIGRFLRLSITSLRMRIQYEDLPTTRRLVSLCQDIYIARAEGLLALEEELYGALLAVYRLPAVMYELTKKKTN